MPAPRSCSWAWRGAAREALNLGPPLCSPDSTSSQTSSIASPPSQPSVLDLAQAWDS